MFSNCYLKYCFRNDKKKVNQLSISEWLLFVRLTGRSNFNFMTQFSFVTLIYVSKKKFCHMFTVLLLQFFYLLFLNNKFTNAYIPVGLPLMRNSRLTFVRSQEEKEKRGMTYACYRNHVSIPSISLFLGRNKDCSWASVCFDG